MTTQQAFDAALQSIESAGAAALQSAGTDALAAVEAAREYVAQLAPDTEELVTAAAEAAARGEDTGTWTAGLTAQLQAAALRTVQVVGGLADAEAARLADVARGALHTLIALAPVLLAAA
jgi:hypothetical protein